METNTETVIIADSQEVKAEKKVRLQVSGNTSFDVVALNKNLNKARSELGNVKKAMRNAGFVTQIEEIDGENEEIVMLRNLQPALKAGIITPRQVRLARAFSIIAKACTAFDNYEVDKESEGKKAKKAK